MLKWVLSLAVTVIVIGLLAPRLSRRIGVGRLPGDLAFRFRGRSYVFPFASTLLFSALLALVMKII